MLGHAVGDALGVPVEFVSRADLDKNPVEDMEGYGTYPYPAGCWSDDTSMSIAAFDSLADNKIDWEEIMVNFGKWYYRDRYTPTGEMFDAGNTCSAAIENYFKYDKPLNACGLTDEFANGNGSLMRILPISLYTYFFRYESYIGVVLSDNYDVIKNISSLTHSHVLSIMSCYIYSYLINEYLKKENAIYF